MKTNILKISILPLAVVVAFSLAEFQPGKENKGNGNNKSEANGGQDRGQGNKGNNNSDRENPNREQGRADNAQGKGRSDQGERGNENRKGNSDQGNRGNQNDNGNNSNDNSRGNSGGNKGKPDNDNGRGNDGNMNKGKGNDNGKSRRETIQWDRDENVNWGFENYSSRKRPGDFKKVTVCHNTGDSDYPVTINVSENALKAHLNHGDQAGNCTGNYSSRLPADFMRVRENVYNNYQTTWETMSYSEALLRFAADKLLGIKSTFQTQRPTLSPDEIQRRELLIMDLQNNVNSLENQLAISRQRTAGLNININL